MWNLRTDCLRNSHLLDHCRTDTVGQTPGEGEHPEYGHSRPCENTGWTSTSVAPQDSFSGCPGGGRSESPGQRCWPGRMRELPRWCASSFTADGTKTTQDSSLEGTKALPGAGPLHRAGTCLMLPHRSMAERRLEPRPRASGTRSRALAGVARLAGALCCVAKGRVDCCQGTRCRFDGGRSTGGN